MVLDATLSIEDAAMLLATTVAEVRGLIEAGELVATQVGAGNRIGWRSLVAALEPRFVADELETTVRRLIELRGAGSIIGGIETDEPDDPRACVPTGQAEDLAILAEAARTVGGGEHLSLAGFDRWTRRYEIALTAATLCKRYGGWNPAKRAAGLATRERAAAIKISNDELLSLLRIAALEPGCDALTMEQFNEYCAANDTPATAALVHNRFGGWNRGKIEAGLTKFAPNYQAQAVRQTHIGAGIAPPIPEPLEIERKFLPMRLSRTHIEPTVGS